MRVTTKGQVTIPLHVRKRLGIFPGTEVEFVLRGDSAALRKTDPKKNGGASRGERLVALLAGSATDRRYTTDEILSMTRGED